MTKKLLFVVNVDWFFVSHRLPIALAAIQQGYEVHLACACTGKEAELEACGIRVHCLPPSRGRAGILNTLMMFFLLMRLFLRLRPNVLHLITIKPVLLGGIAARMLGIPRVVAAISGLGYVFTAEGVVARARRALVGMTYRIALRREATYAVIQNKDDERYMSKVVKLSPSQLVLIRGSGVNLNEYPVRPEPDATPVVLFAARLLRDKGVMEFCEAARILLHTGVQARFCIAGEVDADNPTSLSADDRDRLAATYGVEVFGYCSDMSRTLSDANIVVLPSYREGLPKVLIEAAACARAVITTDVAGCRDAILPDQTGLLVPVKNSEHLANKIALLLNNPQYRQCLGMAGRRFAEEQFDIEGVIQKHLRLYEKLIIEF